MKKPSNNSILPFSSRVDIKPLSVNQCWQGKRFKTVNYKDYEKAMFVLLPDHDFKQPKTPLELSIVVGVSNLAMDVDNVVKPFLDILQKKYNFNDKYVFRLIVEKVLVVKEQEFIEFYIKNFEPNYFSLALEENPS